MKHKQSQSYLCHAIQGKYTALLNSTTLSDFAGDLVVWFANVNATLVHFCNIFAVEHWTRFWEVLVSIGRKMSSFYAVAKGKSVGIFSSWSECEQRVRGYKGAVYKKFSSRKEAEDFIALKSGNAPVPESSNSASSKVVPEMGNQLRTAASRTIQLIPPQPLRPIPATVQAHFSVRREIIAAKTELVIFCQFF